MEENKKLIVRASWISILGNSILSGLKLVIGTITGSLAVIGDGIDSASDILTSIITLVTAKLLTKKPDVRFPYGYAKADTIAARLLSFVIFLAGAQLTISTVKNLMEGNSREIPGIWAIYITLISIAGKFFLAVYQFRISKKTESAMLKANAQNMQNDILISFSVLIGLFFTFKINLPIIDTITALFVSFWIIKTAIKIFLHTNIELMDGLKDSSMYEEVFKAVEEVKEAKNPHRIRIRKLGNMIVIAIDIEVDGDISVDKAHDISMQVEDNIKSRLENVYDIVIHVEPSGNYEKHEKYGISESNFNK
ncbi:MAG: cation transporter [Chlorobi bacterium]|nr:cation transporter [Chlorobiota bacterium]